MSRDEALTKEQTVLRESASFVTEQVAHLTQFLIQGGCAGLSGAVIVLPVHLNIPANQETVHHVDHFKSGVGQRISEQNIQR